MDRAHDANRLRRVAQWIEGQPAKTRSEMPCTAEWLLCVAAKLERMEETPCDVVHGLMGRMNLVETRLHVAEKKITALSE